MPISLELGNAQNVGDNEVYGPTTRPMVITGYQVSAAMQCLIPPQSQGDLEAAYLCQAYITPTLPTFSGPLQQAATGSVPNNDWGMSEIVNPDTGLQTTGLAFATDGALWSVIRKSRVPAAATDPADPGSDFIMTMSGLSIPVSTGSYLVLHCDQQGEPVDIEIQGVIFYE